MLIFKKEKLVLFRAYKSIKEINIDRGERKTKVT